MASPQFGGTNGVPELDIGQTGSVRNIAATALWSGYIQQGPQETAQVLNSIPQQNVSFRDVLGYQGQRVTWSGGLLVTTDAILAAIESDMNRLLHGAATTAGVLGAPNPNLLRETRLANFQGRIMSERAVLVEWRFNSPPRAVISQGSFTIAVPLSVEFRCLA